MSAKRSVATVVMVCTAAVLASCAGTSNEDAFSAYVADHWPHWAGGMPNDVPPRPGTPGYNEFIAHGQANQDAPPPASGANTAAAPVTPVFETAPSAPTASAGQIKPAPQAPGRPPAADTPPTPAAATPPAPSAEAIAVPEPADSGVVRGGLY